MTDNKTRITPPPHLMLRWQEEARDEVRDVANLFDRQSIQMIKAANWGWRQRDANVAHELQKARDEELDACCEWLRSKDILEPAIGALRNARRPKPKSKKEQALEDFNFLMSQEGLESSSLDISARARRVIQALESLPD